MSTFLKNIKTVGVVGPGSIGNSPCPLERRQSRATNSGIKIPPPHPGIEPRMSGRSTNSLATKLTGIIPLTWYNSQLYTNTLTTLFVAPTIWIVLPTSDFLAYKKRIDFFKQRISRFNRREFNLPTHISKLNWHCITNCFKR